MIRYAIGGMTTRPVGSAIAILVLCSASLAISLLVGTSRSAEATLAGDINRAWDTPYDLLVRPPGTVTSLEESDGLVRPNFLSGIHGGITASQLEQVRRVPGVSVAAPVAIVGFVNWPSALQIDLTPHSGTATRVLRASATISGDAGWSTYRVEDRYLVIAPGGQLDIASRTLSVDGRTVNCSYPTNCFAGKVCTPDGCEEGRFPSSTEPRYYLPLMQPLVIAGVDPQAEASLAGLDNCLTDGRLLEARDKPQDVGPPDDQQFTQIPVLVSNRSFVDQTLTIKIDEAKGTVGLDHVGDQTAWNSVETDTSSFQQLFERYAPSINDYVDYWPVWSSGDVAYRTIATGETPHVAATTVQPDLSIFSNASSFVEFDVADSLLVPPEARDPWFRAVTDHRDVPSAEPGTTYRPKIWRVVGHYDPTCLRGFDPLAGGALEAYSFPSVSDRATGRQLTPGRSMSGYLNSPPLVLTNLAGAAWLSDPTRYAGQPGAAFISAIRVRVADLAEPTQQAQARLAAAAKEIAETTGLQVDIVKGASPLPVTVDLPPGQFGRPALSVEEGWSRKGVVLTFREAARSQDVAVSAMVLACGLLFMAETGAVAIERRRRELRVLRALGWSRLSIAAMAELEVLSIGALAALLSLVVGVLLVRAIGVAVDPAVLLIGPLASIVLSALGGIPSSVRASRTHILSSSSNPRSIHQPAGSIVSFALSDLLRSPATVLIGAIALGLSASLLAGLVLVAASFSGRLDATVLGTHLLAEVAPVHLVIAALGLGLGAGAAGQALALRYLERVAEFATLRAIGWPRRAIAAIEAIEGVGILVLSWWICLWTTVVLAAALGASPPAILEATVSGCLAATAAMLVGVAIPVVETHRRTAAASMDD